MHRHTLTPFHADTAAPLRNYTSPTTDLAVHQLLADSMSTLLDAGITCADHTAEHKLYLVNNPHDRLQLVLGHLRHRLQNLNLQSSTLIHQAIDLLATADNHPANLSNEQMQHLGNAITRLLDTAQSDLPSLQEIAMQAETLLQHLHDTPPISSGLTSPLQHALAEMQCVHQGLEQFGVTIKTTSAVLQHAFQTLQTTSSH